VRKIAYHHGDLRRAILDAAVEAIGEDGPGGWSLRELARRAGVSHAAPAHHFGDKTGVLTALATEGFELLAGALEEQEDFLEAGLAYVRFAVEHPVHFTVMFQPSLYRAEDPGLTAARGRAGSVLRKGAPQEQTALAGWSIAHGFASLWLSGAMAHAPGADAVRRARPVLRRLVEH
jgi:AcrR family transcriptional regulator